MSRKLRTQSLSILDKIYQEGESLGNSLGITVADATGISMAGAGYSIGGFGPSALKASYYKSICITSNKDCSINVVQTLPTITGSGTPVLSNYRVAVFAGQPAVLNLDLVLTSSIGGYYTFFIKEIYSTDKTNCFFGISGIGMQFTDDLNFSADKVILHIGDSITNGTGITNNYNCYPWIYKKYFMETVGINARLVNMSVSGSTSVGVETWRKNGRFTLDQIDCIFYSMGMNDAVAGTSSTTYQANLSAIINWKQKIYPTAKLIFLGATPAENNTTETALATLRATMQTVASNAGDSNIRYYSLGASFDRTQGTSVYVGSDTAGSRVHPNESTHVVIGNAIVSFLNSNNITI